VLAGLIAVGLLVLVDRHGSGPSRLLLTLGFTFFVPGRAIVSNWPGMARWSEAAMPMVFSLAVLTLASMIMLWARTWHPVSLFQAEAWLSLAGLCAGAARRHRRQRRPGAPAHQPGLWPPGKNWEKPHGKIWEKLHGKSQAKPHGNTRGKSSRKAREGYRDDWESSHPQDRSSLRPQDLAGQEDWGRPRREDWRNPHSQGWRHSRPQDLAGQEDWENWYPQDPEDQEDQEDWGKPHPQDWKDYWEDWGNTYPQGWGKT
jgi:hypothetical protein